MTSPVYNEAILFLFLLCWILICTKKTTYPPYTTYPEYEGWLIEPSG